MSTLVYPIAHGHRVNKNIPKGERSLIVFVQLSLCMICLGPTCRMAEIILNSTLSRMRPHGAYWYEK
jgi:hypothetical protein